MTSDTTGVRDSVVNQLLAKIDGVKEVSFFVERATEPVRNIKN
jgi:SpoVK/Ycf46/Vps4 family AAA+-type ATPase